MPNTHSKNEQTFMYILGGVVGFSFLFTLAVTAFFEIKSDIFIHVTGMVDSFMGLVVGFYYGTSKGERDKKKNPDENQ